GEHLPLHPNKSHQIGTLVAVEHFLEQLDDEGLFMQDLRAVLGKMAVDVDNVALLVIIGEGEAVIPQPLAQGLGQMGEVSAIAPQQGAQVGMLPSAAKGMDVEVLVANVAMAEDAAIDGVEEGLRHLEVVTTRQQIAEGAFHPFEQLLSGV